MTVDLLAMAACSGTAAVLSLWMFIHGRGSRGLPGCGSGSACDAVARTRWARVGPVPVAALGLVTYAAVVALALLDASRSTRNQHHLAAAAILAGLTPILAGGALWFLLLQAVVVRRLCPYCMLIHGLSLASALLIVDMAAGGLGPSRVGTLLRVHPDWFLPGTLATAVLLAAQLLIRPASYSVRSLGRASVGTPPALPDIRSSTSGDDDRPDGALATEQSSNPYARRTVSVASGQIVLRGDAWPVVGFPEAKHIVVFLFDHTCKVCRQVHRLLTQAIERHPAGLAVMFVPVPADAACNPAIQRRDPQHRQACAYARLGLAVWQADWSKYAEFSAYLSGTVEPPPLRQARRRAAELIGMDLPNPATPDESIDARISAAVRLLEPLGTPRIPTPMLLFPRTALNGQVPTAAHLSAILQRQLGIVATADRTAVLR